MRTDLHPKTYRLLPAVGGRRTDYYDTQVPGLVLRVTATTRSFGLAYWSPRAGKKVRYHMGHVPPLTLATARELARELLRGVAGGGPDPSEGLRAARAQAALAGLTVAQLADRCLEALAARPATLYEYRRMLDVEIRPTDVGATVATELRRAQVRALAQAIAQRGSVTLANRCAGFIRRVLNWAVEEEIIPASPLGNLRKVPGEAPKERILAADEIRAIWLALEALDEEVTARRRARGRPAGRRAGAWEVQAMKAATDVVRLLWLTGVRREMVVGCRLAELQDLEAGAVATNCAYIISMSFSGRGARAGRRAALGHPGRLRRAHQEPASPRRAALGPGARRGAPPGSRRPAGRSSSSRPGAAWPSGATSTSP